MGSEMCIRDRPLTTNRVFQVRYKRAKEASKVKRKKNRRVTKVIKDGPKTKAETKAETGAAKRAKTIKDSSKVFDKAWFKEGPPKYYGRVTVYIDRRARK